MINQPLISIIVPIYNVERYLSACIESVLGQTYRKLEVILVDDGSPDCCPQMCDEYLGRDRRIRVIHQPNGGLSSARNAGLAVATGEFVCHVDGDDRLPVDAIESLLVKQQEGDYDMVFGDYTLVGEGLCEYRRRPLPLAKMELINHMVSNLRFPHYVWSILIRKSIYDVHGIGPKYNVNMGEDLQVLPQLVYYAQSYAKLDKSVYFYTQANTGSLTAGMSYDRIIQDLESMAIVAAFFKNIGKEDLYATMQQTKMKYIPWCLFYLCGQKPTSQYKTIYKIANANEMKPFRHYATHLSFGNWFVLNMPIAAIARCYRFLHGVKVGLFVRRKSPGGA